MALTNQVLEHRRRDCGVKGNTDPDFVDYMNRLKRRITFIEQQPEPKSPARSRPLTPLGEMDSNWLADSTQRAIYQGFLDAAYDWIEKRPYVPGLSFFVSGPVGIGKTTVLRHLQQSLTRTVDVVGEDISFDVFEGKLWTARAAMGYLSPIHGERGSLGQRRPLSKMLSGCKALVIDDIGYEEIPFTSHDDFLTKRVNRYRELFDFCYERNISLLVSSNTPIMCETGFNPTMLEILGDAALDRLLEMAGGSDYVFDLMGVPSYRMHTINQRGRGS